MAKFFHKMSFWGFIGYIVTPFVIAGEGTIVGLDLNPLYHAFIVGAVAISGYIKFYIKDEDGDGIVDQFKKSRKSPNPKKL
jgi:hypothetical protein